MIKHWMEYGGRRRLGWGWLLFLGLMVLVLT